MGCNAPITALVMQSIQGLNILSIFSFVIRSQCIQRKKNEAYHLISNLCAFNVWSIINLLIVLNRTWSFLFQFLHFFSRLTWLNQNCQSNTRYLIIQLDIKLQTRLYNLEKILQRCNEECQSPSKRAWPWHLEWANVKYIYANWKIVHDFKLYGNSNVFSIFNHFEGVLSQNESNLDLYNGSGQM